MQPAADAMQAALEQVTLGTPRVPLVAKCARLEVTNPVDIKQRLVEQVTGLVRWRESVQYMKSAGVQALIECGSGKILSGLVKRIDKEMTGTPSIRRPTLKPFSRRLRKTPCSI